MEIAATLLEVSGLLAVVASLAIIFSQITGWFLGKSKNVIRSTALIVLAFTLAHIFIGPALRALSLDQFADDVSRATALFWWLSLALLIDISVRRFVWQSLLADHGVSHMPKLIRDLVSLLIYAGAVMIIMHFVYDEPIGAVLATSGGLAFVLGFAAQKTIGEAFAGLSLSLSRTLKVGDYLEVNGIYGRVHEMNWRNVSLHNPHTDSLYIFSNSVMASSTILNYNTPSDRFKNWITFVVEPHAAPDLVMRAVLDELRNSRYAFQNPKPDINMLGFTELGIEYRIRYCFDGDDPWWDAQNEVVNAIWNAMRHHGFHFGVNRRLLDTGLEWDTPVEPNFHHEKHDDCVRLMKQIKPFADLPEQQLQKLSVNAELVELTPPETIYTEHSTNAESIYLLQSGSVAHYQASDEDSLQVGETQAGDWFGSVETTFITTAQPLTFSRAWRLRIDQIEEVDASATLIGQLRQHDQSKVSTFALAYDEELEKRRALRHSIGHGRLSDLLRHSYSHYLKGNLFNKVLGAVRIKNDEAHLIETLANACSLLVVVGKPENRDAERDLFDDLVAHLDEVHHVSHSRILKIYDDAVLAAEKDFESSKKHAVEALDQHEINEHEALLMLATMKLISGVSGIPTEEQLSLLSEFQELLDADYGHGHEGVMNGLLDKLKSHKD